MGFVIRFFLVLRENYCCNFNPPTNQTESIIAMESMESIYENPLKGFGRTDTRHGDIEMNTCGNYEPVEPSTSRQQLEQKVENLGPKIAKAEESSISFSRQTLVNVFLATLLISNLAISVVGFIYVTQSKKIAENTEKNLTSMTNKAHASDQQPEINFENLEKNITRIIEKMHADDHESKTIFENLEKSLKIIMNRLHSNDRQVKTTLENVEQNFTRMINKVGTVLDNHLSEELQFLRGRIIDNNAECSSKLRSLKNITYRMDKELNIMNRKLEVFVLPDCSTVSRVWHGSGVFNIFHHGKPYQVYCDTTTDGGGWTVFQRRMDGSVDFYRTWEEYANGFGNKAGEFWLGLENIHQLTQDGAYELRVDLTDWDGSTAYAKYGTFSISGRSDNYRLTVAKYSGTAGDSLTYSSGYPFTAKDKDLDSWGGTNCAVDRVAAWWFKKCAYATLNGRYNDTSGYERGIHWRHWNHRKTYSLKASEMKFRKK